MNPSTRNSLLVGVIGVLVGAALVTNWQSFTATHKPSNAAPIPSVAFAAPLHEDDLEQRIIESVKRTEPSVVLIRSTVRGQQIDPFSQFFGDTGGGNGQPFIAHASGSGFIFRKDGDTAYVATNAHVVYGADNIEVLLANGRKVQAEKVGSDIRSDLAVLRVTGQNLPPALPLGNANALQQGQFVLAIGEPESFQNSVSLGIVSALHRTDITAGGDGTFNIPSIRYTDLMQTTAPINPGNSGGPLVTVGGDVVGIAAVVDPRAQNIGFAIPINSAQPILAQLETHKTISHPYIGVVMTSMNDRISNYLGYNGASGVVVTNVVAGSPADKAGLAQGDVIVELNHNKVKDPSDIANAVSKLKTGDKVSLLVWRKGSLTPFDVTLADMPEQVPQS
ncbi:MAG: trypsin-like peptidase domain-containing protein [Candidatus Eremiobacteraeota bacterium]|nr:trypsin-like peptidase domain-containing protein [Candidatus Eremiobacteraeota bacterium]MBV8365624.1 trypsin-like peptidase domain-containing protein [Candidatus Eremiobacteraeota bacterium]